ncbi:unnamed protein product, partial [Prorocentrum cordatum]
MTLATNRGLMSVRPVEACSTGAGGCVLPDTSNDIEGAPPSTIRPRICAQSDGTLWQFMLVRQLMASEGAPASAGQRLGLRGRPPGNLVAFGNMTAGGAARRSSAANGGSSDGAANAESSSAARGKTLASLGRVPFSSAGTIEEHACSPCESIHAKPTMHEERTSERLREEQEGHKPEAARRVRSGRRERGGRLV